MDYEEEASELTVAEQRAWQEFNRLYAEQNPPPRRPGVTAWGMLGWEFWMMIPVSLATLLLSASRTGSAFYMAAAKLPGLSSVVNGTLGVVEAICAVVAYEGFLVMIGVAEGRKHRMSGALKWGSIALVLVTSTLAGLVVSINISANSTAWLTSLTRYLGILMGLASLLAFSSGHLLGSFYAEAVDKVSDVGNNYANELNAWKAKRQGSWNSKKSSMIYRVSGIKTETQQRTVKVATPAPSDFNVSEAVKQWLADNQVDPATQSVSANQVADELSRAYGVDVNPTTVRQVVFRVRNQQK